MSEQEGISSQKPMDSEGVVIEMSQEKTKAVNTEFLTRSARGVKRDHSHSVDGLGPLEQAVKKKSSCGEDALAASSMKEKTCVVKPTIARQGSQCEEIDLPDKKKNTSEYSCNGPRLINSEKVRKSLGITVVSASLIRRGSHREGGRTNRCQSYVPRTAWRPTEFKHKACVPPSLQEKTCVVNPTTARQSSEYQEIDLTSEPAETAEPSRNKIQLSKSEKVRKALGVTVVSASLIKKPGRLRVKPLKSLMQSQSPPDLPDGQLGNTYGFAGIGQDIIGDESSSGWESPSCPESSVDQAPADGSGSASQTAVINIAVFNESTKSTTTGSSRVPAEDVDPEPPVSSTATRQRRKAKKKRCKKPTAHATQEAQHELSDLRVQNNSLQMLVSRLQRHNARLLEELAAARAAQTTPMVQIPSSERLSIAANNAPPSGVVGLDPAVGQVAGDASEANAAENTCNVKTEVYCDDGETAWQQVLDWLE